MAKRFDIGRFNRILKMNGQVLSAVRITGTMVELSNGLVISDSSSVLKCKRRVMNESADYIVLFDRLYSLDDNEREVAEAEAKTNVSRKGGLSCQNLYGEKIKNNLNTGVPWNKGKELHYDVWHKGKTKETSNTLKFMSESKMGSGNPMYGTTMSDDDKQHRSNTMKEKILSGEFTPNSNNRNTHWEANFDGRQYRSSWEALYQSIDPYAEYESVRIEYDFDGSSRIYIVDFVNHYTKKLIEVKPTRLLSDLKTCAKIEAAKKWCEERGYDFLIADEEYFLNNRKSNLNGFDENTKRKIVKLYETGK